MNAEDVLGLLVPATYFTMLAVERLRPARQFPTIPRWRWIGIGFFLMTGAFATIFPLLLPLDWLAEHRLLDSTGLGVAGGTVVGLLVVSFIGYWYHRATHSFSWLSRLTHQLHHGPQRVDMYGAALFHPTDIAVYIVFPLIVTTFVLGLDPLAAGIV